MHVESSGDALKDFHSCEWCRSSNSSSYMWCFWICHLAELQPQQPGLVPLNLESNPRIIWLSGDLKYFFCFVVLPGCSIIVEPGQKWHTPPGLAIRSWSTRCLIIVSWMKDVPYKPYIHLEVFLYLRALKFSVCRCAWGRGFLGSSWVMRSW